MKNPIEKIVEVADQYNLDIADLVRKFEYQSTKLARRETNNFTENVMYIHPKPKSGSWYAPVHDDASDIIVRYAKALHYNNLCNHINETFDKVD
jgi:hypothetical protein